LARYTRRVTQGPHHQAHANSARQQKQWVQVLGHHDRLSGAPTAYV
jgi:hypothetical protein